MRAIGTMRNRQQGMTFIGWVMALMILGFFVLIGLKLTPVYLEYFAVQRQLTSLEEEAGLVKKSAGQVKRLLLRRFSIDDVKSISPGQIKIAKKDRHIKIQVTWQVRTPMMGNVDALVSFDEKRDFMAR